MKAAFTLALLLSSIAAAADDVKPSVDAKALEPILSHSWTEQACEGPDAATYLRDWVVDIDGTPFQRAGGGYTPLTELSFKDKMLTEKDEVGIGSTLSTYKLQDDGTLRLWSQEISGGDPADGADKAQLRVKDGQILFGDDGKVIKPVDTVSMKPCAQRTALFSAEASAALDGVWASDKGGSCAKGTGAVMIDLKRPIPTYSIGPVEDQPSSDYWVLSLAKTDKGWDLIAGGLFDANAYHIVTGKDALTVSDDSPDPAKTFKRCQK